MYGGISKRTDKGKAISKGNISIHKAIGLHTGSGIGIG